MTTTDILQSIYSSNGMTGFDLQTLDMYVSQILDKSSSNYGLQQKNNDGPHENINQSDASNELYVNNESKINYTDPKLEKTSTIPVQPITVHISTLPESMNEDETVSSTANDTPTNNREEYSFYEVGYVYPLINFNGRILAKHEIAYMSIDFNDITPTLDLGIYDLGISTNIIKQVMPGMDNNVVVKIRPAIDGAYTTKSLTFFITDLVYSTYNGKVIYKCRGSYKLKTLYDQTPVAIKMEHAVEANRSGDQAKQSLFYLSTANYLLEIVYKTKLGFQCTEGCDDVNDERLRYKNNETYIDFIKKHLAFGGVDEHSIFDCWINGDNCLTLINVAWIFEQADKINPNYLQCKAMVGMSQTNGKGIGYKFVETYRTLSNIKSDTYSNMLFDDDNFIIVTDNNARNQGLNSSTMTLGVAGTGNGNNGSMNTSEIMCITNDVDGRNYYENYNIKSFPDIELNMSETNINIIDQRTIRKTFFELKRSKRVFLTLNELNFAIDRGLLINIAYFTTNKEEKAFILNNFSNLFGDDSIERPELTLPSGKSLFDIIEDEFYPVLDMSKSGIYYVDKMCYKYDSDFGKTKQILELIKLGDASTYQNTYSYLKGGFDSNNLNDKYVPDVNTADYDFDAFVTNVLSKNYGYGKHK